MTNRTKTILLLSALVLFLLTFYLQLDVERIDRQDCLYCETTFFSSLIAGSKKFVAHECWNEADVYLHQGLIHEQSEEEDEKHVEPEASSEETHEHEGEYGLCGREHKAAKESVLLPYNRSDFARIRHTRPLDDKELLPWFKMSVYMDPQLTKAYVTGGYWLAFKIGKPREAIDFLKEGLVNNPGAPDILRELGIIYFDMSGRLGTRNLAQALPLFTEALKSEQSELECIELLTYRSESYALIGEYKKALEDIDKKIALMTEINLASTDRFQSTMIRRDAISEKLLRE